MKSIKRIVVITAIFAFANIACADIDTRSYSQGEVFIEYGVFDKDSKTEEELNNIKRCGLCPGVDGYLPFTEALKMWLVVRGEKFMIQPSLMTPLYNLHVGPKFYQRTFSVKETNNGVLVSVSGGDGSGSYDVQFDINLIDMQVIRKLYQHPDRDRPTIITGDVIHAGKAP